MRRYGPEEKRTLMLRVTCENEIYEKFKEIVKPLNVSDALGIMITSAVESNTKPFARVIEDLLRVTMDGQKLGTLLDNIETSRYHKEPSHSTGDESSQPEGKKKR